MFATTALQPVTSLGLEDKVPCGGAGQFSCEEADIPYSTARLFSSLLDKVHLNPDADITSSFGVKDEADVGKNLYLKVYSQTEIQPQMVATKETAGKYGVTEGELTALLAGNYNLILAKKPGMTQSELQNKVLEIQEEHAWRKEILSLKAQIRAEVEVNEIFANGDTSDSGFDLVNDLNIIEELLFLKSRPIDVGAPFSALSNGGGLVGGISAGGSEVGGNNVGGSGEGGGGFGAVIGGGAGALAAGVNGVNGVSPAAGELNPNVCFEDDAYKYALDQFEEKSKTDSNYRDKSTEPPNTPVSDNSSGGATSSDPLPIIPTKPANAPPAPADNWLGDKLCNDVFCLQVNVVSEPVTSAYASSDNCIACHTEKINEVLAETVSHSLTPSKAPGNLGESASCKKAVGTAFSSINMNVYAIAVPVSPPTNDDIIFGTSVEQNWEEFCNRVDLFPFNNCRSPEQQKDYILEKQSKGLESYTLPPILEDIAAKKTLSDGTDTLTITAAAEKIDDIVTSYKIQSDEALKELEQQYAADKNLILFQPLQQEMNRMNSSFSKIRMILQSLNEKVDGLPGKQACTDLKEKKQCE